MTARQSASVPPFAELDMPEQNLRRYVRERRLGRPSFKTLLRSGLIVSPGSTIGIGTLTIAVGGTSEVVTVKGETPLV